MEKRDLKADLEILTGDWGAHESDWFRDNGVAIATHAIERALEAEELNRELVETLKNMRELLTKAREVLVDEA